MIPAGFTHVPGSLWFEDQGHRRSSEAAFVRNQWYVAGRLSELRPGKITRIPICDYPVEFSREVRGRVNAEIADGPPLACEMSEGLVWVFIPSVPGDGPPRIPVPKFGAPKGKIRFMEKVVIPAHQDEAVYGLLDPAHTPFVHRSPIWRGSGVLKEKKKRFEPEEFGFTMMPHAPVNSDIYHLIGGAITVRIHFRLPGLRAEYIQSSKHTVLGLTALTPIDSERTVLRQIFYWDTPVLSLIRPFASLVARPFLQQDVNIMALRRQNRQFGGKGMLVGDSDRQFLWYSQLKKAWAEAEGCPHAFCNPIQPETLRWRT